MLIISSACFFAAGFMVTFIGARQRQIVLALAGLLLVATSLWVAALAG